MKVVFDTNVLVSAFVFPGGTPEDVVRLIIAGHVESVTSPPLLAEFGRVLTDKFGWAAAPVNDAVAQVARLSHVVHPRETITEIIADPADDRVLEAAWSARVDVIVSGDRHLLRLRSWRGISVLKPADFLKGID